MSNFFVLAGPSGVGKTTLIKRLLAAKPEDIVHPLTETTRNPRPGEVEGRDMIFLPHALFTPRLLGGEYLAYTEYAGHFYGTSKAFITQCLNEGKKVVVAFDREGIRCLRDTGFPHTSVYLLAPDTGRLDSWLRQRWPEGGPEYEKRLAQSTREYREFENNPEFRSMFDFYLFSDDMDRMTADMLLIMGF